MLAIGLAWLRPSHAREDVPSIGPAFGVATTETKLTFAVPDRAVAVAAPVGAERERDLWLEGTVPTTGPGRGPVGFAADAQRADVAPPAVRASLVGIVELRL